MNINIRLGKNFTTQLNKFQEKYGEEFMALQGLDDKKLSLTDFIDNFIDSDNVANASVDSNANVAHKDIVSLLSEMAKPHQKILALNKIYYEVQKKYGFKTANEWLENTLNYALYMHDCNTTSFFHYCYKGEELLTIKYHNNLKVISFTELYNLVEEPEQFDITINQKAKFPIELFVLDLDKNNDKIWTKITRIVKHDNNKPMRFIKYANGLSQIVTEDHPIITDDGDIPAKEVTTEHMVFTTPPLQYIDKPKQKGWMTKEFGWLTGMCLAEASAASSTVHLKQTEIEQYEKIIYILNKFNMPFTEYGDHEIRFKVCEQEKFLEELLIGKTAAFKQLPSNFNEFPDEFLDGVVAGLIDGDGTIGGYKNRQCQIRIASEVLCHQISDYLKNKDVFCGDRTPYKYSSEKSFKQKLPMFGIAFTLTNEEYFQSINSIKIANKYIPRKRQGNFKNKHYQYKYNWVNITENTEYIDDCPIVYDITTETGHFICNNVLSHNCFAYDLKDVAERGLFFIDGYSAEPPKHLDSFVQILMEWVCFCSRRQSGAVGMPNLIPYLYYFWSRDVKNGYYTVSPERYARQQIQALIYRLNQPWVRTEQAAFTNTSIFDHPYFEAIFGSAQFPDGEYMIEEEEEIIEFQKLFMEVMSECRSHNMATFPVNTISLLFKDGKFVDEEFAKWACKHNMKWNDSNFFTDSSVNSLSNCCRLKSDIRDLYFNSIGGAALKVGSVKVSTVNLARIAYKHKNDEEGFLKELKNITEINLKGLDCVRHIIKRNVEKGLLPTFSHGLVDFEHLYNTLGINGIFETMKTFGYTYQDSLGNTYYSKEAMNFGEKIFKVFDEVIAEFSKDKDYKINKEQVPAEQAAVKMFKADSLLYPELVVKDLPLYGNQWIPLGIKTTLAERVRICSTFDKYCNGGSILHCNVDAPFDSFDKAWNMLNWMATSGVTYFAFTGKISACKHNHAFYGDVCPLCGGPVETYYSRIVGFFTPVKAYSKERKAEWELRQWENINESKRDN